MPRKAASYCRYPNCENLAIPGSVYCQIHQSEVKQSNTRVSSTRRGYGRGWQKIRADVLRQYGIHREDWPKYDVDHVPRYDPIVEPDHRKYTLIPRLHAEHSKKTVREDGGFGRKKK
jgi:5-methylcytosine-specific restriction enzyme A